MSSIAARFACCSTRSPNVRRTHSDTPAKAAIETTVGAPAVDERDNFTADGGKCVAGLVTARLLSIP